MKAGDDKHDTKRRIRLYIDNRLAGLNKQDSALDAGYDHGTSRVPAMIENTKTYQIMVNETMINNQIILRETMQELAQTLESKPVDWKKAENISNVAKKQAEIHNIFTPKVTIKEKTNADGTKERTAWGTNASLLKDTLGDDENSQEE